jgi:fructose-bisphosphate aldolase class I
MDIATLVSNAQALVAPGKGILAIDESTGTIAKRLASVNVENTADHRRDYRSMLLTTPGLGEHIAGAILYDETLRQQATDGRPMIEVLDAQGILPGIKVDTGAKPLANHEGEKVTEGLDGLRERLQDYHRLGARFAKWRAVITIGDGLPSKACVDANAHALARYAALCQENGLVPIVEPEVLMDGPHDIDDCFDVTEATLRALFAQLYDQGVVLEGAVLKASMVISGSDCDERADRDEVAQATVTCLLNAVPAAVAGIVFLSGGQADVEATEHLQAMNALGDFPWPLSFSYGRALQQAALHAWGADPSRPEKAQRLLAHRARMNGLAAQGKYSPDLEQVH